MPFLSPNQQWQSTEENDYYCTMNKYYIIIMSAIPKCSHVKAFRNLASLILSKLCKNRSAKHNVKSLHVYWHKFISFQSTSITIVVSIISKKWQGDAYFFEIIVFREYFCLYSRQLHTITHNSYVQLETLTIKFYFMHLSTNINWNHKIFSSLSTSFNQLCDILSFLWMKSNIHLF